MTLLIAGKFLLYMGVLLLVGGTAARHLLAPQYPRLRWLLVGLLLLTLGACVGVYAVLAELEMLNLTDSLDYLTRIPAGRSALLLLLGACVLLAAHISRFSRLTEVGAAALTLWGLAGIGHGATHGEWVRFLHTVHAGAMSVWAGGLLFLLFTAGVTGTHVKRFSPVATACIVLLPLSGLLMILNHAGSLPELPQTPYGRLLLVKVGVFGLALVVALLVRRKLTDSIRLQSFQPKAELLVEALLILLVLGLTAGLSQWPPPAHA